jgi:hypothetical protein
MLGGPAGGLSGGAPESEPARRGACQKTRDCPIFSLAISGAGHQALRRIIARMPALVDSGSVGQALTMAAKPGSFGVPHASNAPDSATRSGGPPEIPAISAGVGVPRHPLAHKDQSLPTEAVCRSSNRRTCQGSVLPATARHVRSEGRRILSQFKIGPHSGPAAIANAGYLTGNHAGLCPMKPPIVFGDGVRDSVWATTLQAFAVHALFNTAGRERGRSTVRMGTCGGACRGLRQRVQKRLIVRAG